MTAYYKNVGSSLHFGNHIYSRYSKRTTSLLLLITTYFAKYSVQAILYGVGVEDFYLEIKFPMKSLHNFFES